MAAFSLFLLFYCALSKAIHIEKNIISNPTSCLGLEDGEHYIRPAIYADANDHDTSTLPSILVRCSNGWTILDHSLDAHIEHYFSSFMQVTDDFASMDIGTEHVNWPQWLRPQNMRLTTSADCHTCTDTHID